LVFPPCPLVAFIMFPQGEGPSWGCPTAAFPSAVGALLPVCRAAGSDFPVTNLGFKAVSRALGGGGAKGDAVRLAGLAHRPRAGMEPVLESDSYCGKNRKTNK